MLKVADALFAIGLAGTLMCYLFLDFAKNDFRPLALGGGFSLAAPVIALHIAAALNRRSSKEVVAAYAVHQRVPVPVLYLLTAVGVVIVTATMVANS